jgi:hypothetical protein
MAHPPGKVDWTAAHQYDAMTLEAELTDGLRSPDDGGRRGGRGGVRMGSCAQGEG